MDDKSRLKVDYIKILNSNSSHTKSTAQNDPKSFHLVYAFKIPVENLQIPSPRQHDYWIACTTTKSLKHRLLFVEIFFLINFQEPKAEIKSIFQSSTTL